MAATPAAAAAASPPPIVYGTAWKAERTGDLVGQALRAGYRGIDTACQPKHYNEPGVGAAVAGAIESGLVTRSQLWLQTKFTSLGGQDPAHVPYDHTAPIEEQVAQSLAASLQNLGTDYIDSLVLHSPLATHELTMRAWRVMEGAVRAGSARTLGVSNLKSLSQLQAICVEATIQPSVSR
jgi:diketogulonate reductase-like aldo/keto reductase